MSNITAAVNYISPRQRSLTVEESIIREVAYALKGSAKWAIEEASYLMAEELRHLDSMLLVPIPSSKGCTADNYRLCLAIIAKAGHGKIADILSREKSVPSSSARRVEGIRGINISDHHMILKTPPPKHPHIILIDNVTTTGNTFKAAQALIHGALGFAYARAEEVI